MQNIKRNSETLDLEPPDPGDMISDVYYSLEDAAEVAKEFPELEKGVLKMLREEYDMDV